MYKTITLPPGTVLFRTPEYPKGGDESQWFSQDAESSRVYSRDGRVSEFQTTRPLVLLDVWTPETWTWLYTTFPGSKYDLDSYSGKGYLWESESDPSGDFVKKFYDPIPKPFEGGTVETKTGPKPLPFGLGPPAEPKKYSVLNWRGLTWGPKVGEYKRASDLAADHSFADLVKSAALPGVDGLYAPILPAPRHFIPHLGIRKAFHDEVVVFPRVAGKVTLVKQGGRRKKSTRRRSRFNKQMRLTRRNAIHLKH